MFSPVAIYYIASWLYTVKTYHTNGVLYGTVGVLITNIAKSVIGTLHVASFKYLTAFLY